MNGANLSIKDNFMVKAVLLFILATSAFYLLTQHRMHLLANSSYILFSGYILLHIFMCLGHGKHGGHEKNGEHGGHCGGHDLGKHKHSLIRSLARSYIRHCGHDQWKHKHRETEKKETQNARGHEDVYQHEHIQEKFT
jgi:hypothetical protein